MDPAWIIARGSPWTGFEQSDETLVRFESRLPVLRKDGNDFRTERCGVSKPGRHSRKRSDSAGLPRDNAYGLNVPRAIQCFERPLHHLDAVLHRQQVVDVPLADD